MFSFGIIAENFEVFENDIFDSKVLWVVGTRLVGYLPSHDIQRAFME